MTTYTVRRFPANLISGEDATVAFTFPNDQPAVIQVYGPSRPGDEATLNYSIWSGGLNTEEAALFIGALQKAIEIMPTLKPPLERPAHPKEG